MSQATTNSGIWNFDISEIPISVIDFETTGLTAGIDRVVEVSVVRCDPKQKPQLVLDTETSEKTSDLYKLFVL